MGLRLMMREGGTLNIADGLIYIDFIRCENGRASILIEAPKDIRVMRQELVENEITKSAQETYQSGLITLQAAQSMVRGIRGITDARADLLCATLERLTPAEMPINNSGADLGLPAAHQDSPQSTQRA